jgi:NAD(P)-dependent dehydrogenase (short-subunit alcohol dehydrogenase family)
MNTTHKVWLITGTSSGFGRNIAELLIKRGDIVIATARDPSTIQDLVKQAPERVMALRLDVTKSAEIESAVAAVLNKFGRIDVLINNAGYSVVGAVEETSETELRALFEPMFFGAVAMTRAVLPHMRERKSGSIVQLTSVGGVVTAPGFGPYCAAKHALEAISEALAAEVAPFGIRVLIVEPGAFRTSLFGSSFRTMPENPAYKQSVGATREYSSSMAGKQPGDPVKAAVAIVAAVEGDMSPLRLPLGTDAVEGIRKKLAQVSSDVDRTEKVAAATAF